MLCLDFPGFSCTYIEKYAHLDFSFQMRNTAFRLLWSKVKRSKIGLFSGPFLLTGRVLISLFTNSPKIYLSVHRLCHLLLQNIFLCRRKKKWLQRSKNMGRHSVTSVSYRILLLKYTHYNCSHFSLGLWVKTRPLANKFLTFLEGLHSSYDVCLLT